MNIDNYKHAISEHDNWFSITVSFIIILFWPKNRQQSLNVTSNLFKKSICTLGLQQAINHIGSIEVFANNTNLYFKIDTNSFKRFQKENKIVSSGN